MRAWTIVVVGLLIAVAWWAIHAAGATSDEIGPATVRTGARDGAGPTLIAAAPSDATKEESAVDEEDEEDDELEEPEAPPAPVAPRDRPDPVEPGPCTLELRVVDDTPEAARVDSHVRLWRLSAPATEHWSEGDQLQASGYTPKDGGLTFPGLPRGTYRAEVLARRVESEDPPPFEVHATRVEHTVTVPTPRSLKAYVRVVDGRGEQVREAWLRFCGCATTTRLSDPPAWRSPRRTPGGEKQRVSRPPCGSVTGSGNGKEWWQAAHERGFEFHFQEASLDGGLRSTYQIRVPEQGWASFTLDATEEGAHGDRQYVVAIVPPEQLATHVTLPGGRAAADANARIGGYATPVRLTADDAADAWRRTVFEISVSLEGYDALCFETDLSGPPAHWVLVAPEPGREPQRAWDAPVRKERRGEPKR